ncbi:hypothetical protein EHS25_000932 [Saitozyma podzolica]|uniref:Uncharacterized protein n=1 Tax=Saitozyma podzolica TaxID=1890683 RepID=A0A427YXN2_9TREE|nr:hypothetical protein EHS25_000932 [Saitozyma podzolica]
MSSALTARPLTFGQRSQATLAQHHDVRPRVTESTEVADMAKESGMDRDTEKQAGGKQAGGKQAGGGAGEVERQGVKGGGGDNEGSKGRGELDDDWKWTVKWDGLNDPEDPLKTPKWKKW